MAQTLADARGVSPPQLVAGLLHPSLLAPHEVLTLQHYIQVLHATWRLLQRVGWLPPTALPAAPKLTTHVE